MLFAAQRSRVAYIVNSQEDYWQTETCKEGILQISVLDLKPPVYNLSLDSISRIKVLPTPNPCTAQRMIGWCMLLDLGTYLKGNCRRKYSKFGAGQTRSKNWFQMGWGDHHTRLLFLRSYCVGLCSFKISFAYLGLYDELCFLWSERENIEVWKKVKKDKLIKINKRREE
jgi:hypothetical protein